MTYDIPPRCPFYAEQERPIRPRASNDHNALDCIPGCQLVRRGKLARCNLIVPRLKKT